MPDEIILHIFTKLTLPDLIFGARLTCWRWYRLSKDTSLWINVDLSSVRCCQNVAKIRAGVKNLLYDIHISLEKLIFSNLCVDGGIYELFGSSWKRKNKPKFENLKSLDYSYSNVSPRNLRVALITHPDLEELRLIYTKISLAQAMEEAIHLPNLKLLVYHDYKSRDLSENPVMNKFHVMRVPKHCTNLEVVEMHTLLTDFDDDVINQFIKYCPKLRRLSLTWSTNLTADAFGCLNPETHHITELGLLDRQETGPYLDFVLPHFPNLLQLTVSGQNIHLEDCIAIGECCPKLKELVLEIDSIRNVSSYHCKNNSLCGLELQKIASNCKDLRKLHAPFSDIDDDGVIFLTEQCLFLEDVNFSQCHRLSKDSINALSKHSICLRKLHLVDNTIDHKYLLSLVTKCRWLEELIFDSKLVSQPLCQPPQASTSSESTQSMILNDNIPFIDMTQSADEYHALFHALNTDSQISQLSETEMNTSLLSLPDTVSVKWNHCHLKKLSLKYSMASEQCLEDIFKECPDLTCVSLDGAKNLTNNLIISLAKSCPNLRNLSISLTTSLRNNCEAYFGDEGLMALIKYSHNLEMLSFLYNSNISQVGLTNLFLSLDSSLRSLVSVSLCVGSGYPCNISIVKEHGLKYLTEQSKQQLKDATSTTYGISFMILHLDFQKRKYVC